MSEDTTPPVLLAVSHGTSDPSGRRAVGALVAAVRAAATVPVRGGFVDVQPPDVSRLLADVPAASAALVVPLLLSAGYHVHVDLADGARTAERVVRVTRALGPDDRLVTVLRRRLLESGLEPDDVVVMAAAGSSDERAVDDCREMARRLGIAIERPVTVGFLSAASPSLATAVAEARDAHPTGRIVVSTYLLAPGYFADLVGRVGADVVTPPLLTRAEPAAAELVAVILDRYMDGVREFHERPDHDLSLASDSREQNVTVTQR